MSSDMTTERAGSVAHKDTAAVVRAGLQRRYRAERRFKLYGLAGVAIALLFLAFLFGSIISKGYTAFWLTELKLTVHLSEQRIDPQGTRDPDVLRRAYYQGLVRTAMSEMLPGTRGRQATRELDRMVSPAAGFKLRRMVMDNPDLIGTTQTLWVPASDDIDMLRKGYISRDVPESERRVTDRQLRWLDKLAADGLVRGTFNWRFFANSASREPEIAGIWGAVVGSALTLAVTLALSFPLGVMTAIYLEEFAPRNKWTDLIEVNINNLAAVPSIIFGLLGLAVFLNFFGLPRSAPLVGGLVLTLMTLPTIIISARSALRSVPPSIREAALAMGASPLQAVTHHVFPLALPGMLTGTIIGMAQALGETAPLLMIGMVAFVSGVPSGLTDSATVLPVQIYLWSGSAEVAYVERTAAAIMVLLAFLVLMNATAVILRKRFEVRW